MHTGLNFQYVVYDPMMSCGVDTIDFLFIPDPKNAGTFSSL
ncbi:hypothetical protein MMALV_12070 [Candidatus Methanomethylophilus alvi Mx1201]|uniref:Uncharacterized protein n=1 Tax=Methanomethylophilus alvi (strain Mx1201) TaxID=1236689 RepID=M9SE17_METAX|nr:hypothetical protein MMALV_12070 [Candidatus Methanomethylophilus alvi Mx1201]